MMIEIGDDIDSRVLICIMYRPPKTGNFDTFVDALGEISYQYQNIIILDDFNVDMLSSNRQTRMIEDFIVSQNLFLVRSNATHHCRSSHTWLDLVIVDDLEKVSNFNQSGAPFLSGHELISFDYTISCNLFKNFSFEYRDYKSFDQNSYLCSLEAGLNQIQILDDCDIMLTEI